MKFRTMMMQIAIAIALGGALALPSAAWGAAAQVSRGELKERFEQRFAQLEKLKAQGKVGETWKGFVEAVESESELNRQARDLLDQENADRRALYKLIAEDVTRDQKSPDEVGERNARRKFAKAKPEEFLKAREGFWFKREEVNPLKEDGKVGETWKGYIEPVEGQNLNQRQRALIDLENRIRAEIYERQAEKRESAPHEEAQRAGERNIDDARPGEYTKAKNGEWRRKT